MKRSVIVTLLLVMLSVSSPARNVVTWIPVYGISSCKTLMNNATTSEWLKNGLTHIGLQFWAPGDNGAVVFVTNYQYTWKASSIGQDVSDFVSWGNANNVKTMLCLYNVRDADFDWMYAKNVIDHYPNETVGNIMTIVNTYGLDGVDIDFEGLGNHSADKNAFVSFLDTLGKALHASGKELSVDMFSTPCYNVPNPSWESAMAPHVDFMNLMGYTDTYEGNNTLFQYCPQTPSENNSYAFRYSYIENYLTATQAVASSKLNYGLPTWVSEWGDKCVQGNIIDIMDISSGGGIALWDLQLEAGSFWRDPATWNLIAMFRNNNTSAQVKDVLEPCVVTSNNELKKYQVHIMHYNSSSRTVQLSETRGDLYLYSTPGVLQKSWKVTTAESIPIDYNGNGFYILQFISNKGVFSQCIYLTNDMH